MAGDDGGDPFEEEDVRNDGGCEEENRREGISEKNDLVRIEFEKSPAGFEKMLMQNAGLEEEDDGLCTADVEEITETETDSNFAKEEMISCAPLKLGFAAQNLAEEDEATNDDSI
ncbi:UNVERIFIED_CONTAM: hypothetical protein Sindi_1302600 [Sesamum indicum]